MYEAGIRRGAAAPPRIFQMNIFWQKQVIFGQMKPLEVLASTGENIRARDFSPPRTKLVPYAYGFSGLEAGEGKGDSRFEMFYDGHYIITINRARRLPSKSSHK